MLKIFHFLYAHFINKKFNLRLVVVVVVEVVVVVDVDDVDGYTWIRKYLNSLSLTTKIGLLVIVGIQPQTFLTFKVNIKHFMSAIINLIVIGRLGIREQVLTNWLLEILNRENILRSQKTSFSWSGINPNFKRTKEQRIWEFYSTW